MTTEWTFTDEHRFLFTSDVLDDEVRTFIGVHWTGAAFTPDESFLRPLRTYLGQHYEVAEVWFLYPSDLGPQLAALQQLKRFPKADEGGIPLRYRFFSVDADGSFHEQFPAPAKEDVAITAELMQRVLEDGLRQLFRDTGAHASAAAGFHFAHPGGAHSEHFIRTSQAVSRLQHAFFVAMTLLPLIARRGSGTVWVDTAGVDSVGYAYTELLRRLGGEDGWRVESFGGHEQLATRLRPVEADIVLISGSTSASLARKVMQQKKVEGSRVVTLFFLSRDKCGDDDGRVLCDLTNRDENPRATVRDARIEPYARFPTGANCDLCTAGSGTIVLSGDSFFPATTVLDLRMPSFYDRPLNGERQREREDLPKFDGSDYFDDLFGLNAITYDPGTTRRRVPHGVSTRIGHLLGEDGPALIRNKVVASINKSAEDLAVAVVLSLTDDDSVALGRLAGKHLLGDDVVAVPADPDAPWRVWRRADVSGIDVIPAGDGILVCAGVVGSGRQLTSVSRELRKVEGEFHVRYLVGAAHPESSTTWGVLSQTLFRASPTETSELRYVWRIPREQRFPDAPSPWNRERTVLDDVGSWLLSMGLDDLATALEPRVLQLSALSDNALFVGAGTSTAMRPVNRKFALWPFAWDEHLRAQENGAVPTHAEIYATVAHLLYESRRLSPRVDSRTITPRRHGYALQPAMFDRFNDPVIQAAFLRAAEPGELHYETDPDASRAVADIVSFVLSNHAIEAGDASYEFLLALAEGLNPINAYGLRLSSEASADVLSRARTEFGEDFKELSDTAPRLRALLLYLQAQA